MNKLTKVNTGRPVCHSVARIPSTAAGRVGTSCVRGGSTDASWIEVVDHVVFGARPVVGLAMEVLESMKIGRVPLRAVVLTAMLVI